MNRNAAPRIGWADAWLARVREQGWIPAMLIALALAGCSGGGNGAPSAPLTTTAPAGQARLTHDDVTRVLAQAAAEAQARGASGTFAVVDRVGNVLALYEMAGARRTVDVIGGRGVRGGLDAVLDLVPASAAAISKAVTGAYLSSSGNAFSTRTAGLIIQPNFYPDERGQPSGPLFGVQFSQLACSDLMQLDHGQPGPGPHPSPLGLSADPGGLPLYKDGVVVGGIGVMADGIYGVDLVSNDIDQDVDELIAVAASAGFEAPQDIRGSRITADGRSLRYVDAESVQTTPILNARLPEPAVGRLITLANFVSSPRINEGLRYGDTASGYRADMSDFAAAGGWILTDATGGARFPLADGGAPLPSAGGLRREEVRLLLQNALAVAQQTRAQIRRPLGSAAQVNISVVDADGNVLGFVRTADAPVFGSDVSLQKARTAAFFSHPLASQRLQQTLADRYLGGDAFHVASSVDAARAFFARPTLLADGLAFSSRAVGLIARPFYPDGIAGTPPGPLSRAIDDWSPFHLGLQLDLVYNELVRIVSALAQNQTLQTPSPGCGTQTLGGVPRKVLSQLRNGIQTFPGGVPIYRGQQLVGAIGVSGDGVDQDDMIGFLGLHITSTAMQAVGTVPAIQNAPAALRADHLSAFGSSLRYVQCPPAPFNGRADQNVCSGL